MSQLPKMGQGGTSSQAHQRRILLVDDDEGLRSTLAEQLSLEGEFTCVEAGSGAEALKMALAERPDAILLDVGLPDDDGRQVCASLRKAGVSVPIIMVTASSGEADTIHGLDMGANDYIAKPFRLGELLARLRAHLRQHAHSEDALLAIGPYVFKPNVKMLVDEKAGKKIRLTEKETAILKYLYRAGQKAVSRETLLGEVWGYNAGVTTHTLETHVYRLRQKIEKDPARAQILLTDSGGYKLVP
ncbi:DNA-binding response OmpR family regulator [Dongia mobilis]|uniref:DNA-binding response OmpR family regulator n=1 Tax=Dongia mobilis TaxID=578943 RepID=A0A4R6WYD7_9PROT|nr:response regulator transcription factor [Dongia mobilis]TDQ86311.1 DNA-binding response OmpR family regulator [Dongia mobilis]